MAPNALSEAFCASVKPVTPVMFTRSYGLSLLNVLRQVPVCTSQSLIVLPYPFPSALLFWYQRLFSQLRDSVTSRAAHVLASIVWTRKVHVSPY